MNKHDEKLLLEIARARLANRPGAFERFQLDLHGFGLGHLRAWASLQLDDMKDMVTALGSVCPNAFNSSARQMRMERIIDEWAALQPAPRPLKVEALPPLPSAVEGVSASPATAPPRSIARLARKQPALRRRDLLTPLIEKAISEHGEDVQRVFGALRVWAEQPPPVPPLRGVTEDGRVQWRDSNDAPQELNIGALRDRMRRLRKAPTNAR
ncbi:hypothetical protein [Oryzisolibacter propanilivorax]|uniref:hypothetical protein n=1 Tax=Oryzisolibacter propanilivorax TaxID=1527607 RepID=UPI001114589B|nr:hypothetical protein [Oryzisolibacter propanilivorax]